MDQAPGSFRTTRWSVIVDTGRGVDDARRGKALEELCTIYWGPVMAFYQRKGHGHADAQDLTQGLFAQLLEKSDFEKADPDRGRFRSYLKSCAQNFAIDQRRAATTQKRGGGRPAPLSLHPRPESADGDAAKLWAIEPVDQETPDQTFEREFALALLNTVMDQLRGEFAARGRTQMFDAMRNTLEVDNGPAYATIAAQLDMTEGAVKVAVHRLRQRFRTLLLDEVRQTLADPDEAADELDQLLAALSGGRR